MNDREHGLPIRLVALDLDGTLLDEELRISPRVAQAVARALAGGVWVTLATGRAFTSAQPFAEALAIKTPLIGYQGGVIGDPVTGEILYQQTMPREVAH